MNPAKTFKFLTQLPLGKSLFSWLVCSKAPYFSSISPEFLELTETRCSILLRKRKKVLNHIGTVHAIALCNACELAMGMTIQSGLLPHLRWIPKGMKVQYLKKAATDIKVICEMPYIKKAQPGDVTVLVRAFDLVNQEVMNAEIVVYLSEVKKIS
ncbi:MAG: hotdog fold domain-containing protein [Bdellovibrionales bacterium]